MAIISASKSDIGRNPKRQNEDYIWFDKDSGLYIVADGMGGQEAGEVASEMASNTVGDLISKKLVPSGETLSVKTIETLMIGAIETANEAVSKAAEAASQKRKMGATIVVALLYGTNAYISHAGDARAYLIRGATLMQLTKDDSWSAELAAEGIIPQEKIQDHIYSNIVTKAIGQGSVLAPSFTEVPLTPGDLLLLCSDGLWNMVPDDKILEIIQNAKREPTPAVEALVDAANEAGGKDNISITIIKMVED